VQVSEILPLYGEIRNTIEGIHNLAKAIDTDLARLQIYREQEAIPRALDRAKELAEKIALLERSFGVCADQCAPSPQRKREGTRDQISRDGVDEKSAARFK